MLKKRFITSINGLIESFRFISVSLTLTMYLLEGMYERYDYRIMLFIAFCVIASAFLFNYLYRGSYGSKYRIHILLAIEIIGISVLMFFTGGLKSPFTWCFFNPLLIISSYMNGRQKILYLAVNFVLLCFIGYFRDTSVALTGYLMEQSNIILSYLLILVLVNTLFYYNSIIEKGNKKLQEANNKLKSYNRKMENMIQHVLDMYEAVQALPGQKEVSEVFQVLYDFAGRSFAESNVFFVPWNCNDAQSIMSLNNIEKNKRERIFSLTKELMSGKKIAGDIFSKDISDMETILLIKVGNMKCYGVFGLITPCDRYLKAQNEYDATFLLYSQLSLAFLKKIEEDAVSHEMVIADEQNRIADDIHDSVVQRLFAMSCLTFEIIKNWDETSDTEKKKQIRTVMETIRSSLIDLRSTIYNLSSKKQEIDRFEQSIKSYLEDLERLTGIKINVDLEGDFSSFQVGAKKAIYRIITESVGNAIKHAKCEHIDVIISVCKEHTNLVIKDDGSGFDFEKAQQEKKGLGLYNIKGLVRMFSGSIDILPSGGTELSIKFANSDIMKGLKGI